MTPPNEQSAEPLNRQVLAEGRFYRMIDQGGWEYIEPTSFAGVVLIVPVTDDGRVVLIEQYRVPVDAQVIEIPAGLVGDQAQHDGESLEAAARRELIEETGYEAARMDLLTEGAPSAGSNRLVLALFKATGLKKVGLGGGDETEDILVHEVPPADVPAWLGQQQQAGKVIDLKLYAGLYFLQAQGNGK